MPEHPDSCFRCGSKNTKLDKEDFEGKVVWSCVDVWQCEKNSWQFPCCFYCHKQYNPTISISDGECPEAPADLPGHKHHNPGGRLLTPSQRRQVELDKLKPKDEMVSKEDFFEMVDRIALEKLNETSVDDYHCKMCNRTKKPKRPVSCVACNTKNGFRKGYGKNLEEIATKESYSKSDVSSTDRFKMPSTDGFNVSFIDGFNMTFTREIKEDF
jgi:hypothetical protein